MRRSVHPLTRFAAGGSARRSTVKTPPNALYSFVHLSLNSSKSTCVRRTAIEASASDLGSSATRLSSGISIDLKRGFFAWFTHKPYLMVGSFAPVSCTSPLLLAYSSAVCRMAAVVRSSFACDRARMRKMYALSASAASAFFAATASAKYDEASAMIDSLSITCSSTRSKSPSSRSSDELSYEFISFSIDGSGRGLHDKYRSQLTCLCTSASALASTAPRFAWNSVNSASSACSAEASPAKRSSSSALSRASSASRANRSSSSIFSRSSSSFAAASAAAFAAASASSRFFSALPPFPFAMA
mmetsp:Transcript_15465/g.50863  ORF Transcript_15465/g.50863 Transcript_15465/m.50863 type:complete len:301 (-) Transcript_15465:43-945(-)